MAFFSSVNIGTPDQSFVAWIDMMGCRNLMNGPINVAAQSIYKVHVAALEASQEDVLLYPLMDGIYATTSDAQRMKSFLRSVFDNLFFDLKNDTGKPGFQYLARGAVAYGEIYHGRDLPDTASKVLAENSAYRCNLVIGLPVVNAFLTESTAPPFGVSIHESCGNEFEDECLGTWWKWFPESERLRLRKEILLYFKGKRKYPELGYPASKITVHEALAARYLEGAKNSMDPAL